MSPNPPGGSQPLAEDPAKHAGFLAARARQLANAWAGGHPTQGLAGRNLGLLCEDATQPAALAIHAAALALGARVSLVRPRFDDVGPDKTAVTGRLLGRLYDGLVCIDMAPALVLALRQSASIPVVDGALATDAIERAAADLSDAGGEGDRRRFLWQAALLDGLR